MGTESPRDQTGALYTHLNFLEESHNVVMVGGNVWTLTSSVGRNLWVQFLKDMSGEYPNSTKPLLGWKSKYIFI